MDAQSVPATAFLPRALLYGSTWGSEANGDITAPWLAGPNDGGIKRGDREDTGDNQADLDEMGPGPAQPTVDRTSMGGNSPIGGVGDLEGVEGEDLDGMEIMHVDDGRLGLVGVDGSPDEDWAADSGPTMNPGE